METVQTAFLDREPCGGDVITCRFRRPADYSFEPGQFMMLGLQTVSGLERKPFTIASAPEDDWLEVTTRMSGSDYKRALEALTPGQQVTVSRPAGRLVLPPGHGPIAFLVGGVGVTPAHSMLRHAMLSGHYLDAVLFYGNRDATCMPYADEFDAMRENGVRTVHVLQFPPDGWEGESGFITADLVGRTVEADGMLWVSSGPPAMIAAMEAVLDELGVPAGARLIERFTGYA